MDKLVLKTPQELKIMAEGGRRLHEVKMQLADLVTAGVRASDIEKKAVELIGKTGGEAVFMKVPGYHWATCINVNAGIVHGIPTSDIIFKSGDVVSIDVGLLYRGFITDTSITVGIDLTPNQQFLDTGKVALKKAISKALVGNYIYDISRATEETILAAGYRPIEDLVGHGVGKALHEDPAIPCIARGDRGKSVKIEAGMTLAIEIMYTPDDPKLIKEKDGWTIAMADGKISALYEETIAVTHSGTVVLT